MFYQESFVLFPNLFLNIYRKINFMAKNGGDLHNFYSNRNFREKYLKILFAFLYGCCENFRNFKQGEIKNCAYFAAIVTMRKRNYSNVLKPMKMFMYKESRQMFYNKS